MSVFTPSFSYSSYLLTHLPHNFDVQLITSLFVSCHLMLVVWLFQNRKCVVCTISAGHICTHVVYDSTYVQTYTHGCSCVLCTIAHTGIHYRCSCLLYTIALASMHSWMFTSMHSWMFMCVVYDTTYRHTLMMFMCVVYDTTYRHTLIDVHVCCVRYHIQAYTHGCSCLLSPIISLSLSLCAEWRSRVYQDQ